MTDKYLMIWPCQEVYDYEFKYEACRTLYVPIFYNMRKGGEMTQGYMNPADGTIHATSLNSSCDGTTVSLFQTKASLWLRTEHYEPMS